MKKKQSELKKRDNVAAVLILIVMMIIFYFLSVARTKYEEKMQKIPQEVTYSASVKLAVFL